MDYDASSAELGPNVVGSHYNRMSFWPPRWTREERDYFRTNGRWPQWREVRILGDQSAEEYENSISHEVSHLLENVVGEFTPGELASVERELRIIYERLNGAGHTPGKEGYGAHQELGEYVAEAFRFARQNPELAETLMPRFTDLLRLKYNRDPRISPYLQINQLAPWMLAGPGLAMTDQGEPDDRAHVFAVPTMHDVLLRYGILGRPPEQQP